MLKPAPLGRGVRRTTGEVLRIHVLVVEDDQGVAEALREVRRPVQAEAEDSLGDKARPATVRSIQQDSDLTKLGGGNREMVEVILDVVVRAVERRPPSGCRPAEHRHVPHDVLEIGLHLLRPLGGVPPPVGGRDRVRSGKAALPQPIEEDRPAIREEVLGRVIDARCLVEGEGTNPSGVEGRVARSAPLGGTPPPVRL